MPSPIPPAKLLCGQTINTISTMSQEGGTPPTKLEGKFVDAEGKEDDVAKPITVEVNTAGGQAFDITVSPKPKTKEHRSTAESTVATASSLSTATSPITIDASTMTENVHGGVAKKLSDVKAKMKDNQAFIREKAMERKSIDEQIQEKTKEIEHLSKIMVELIESEQAKMADFEMKNDTMNAELMKLREESKTLQQDFNNLFQNMGLFHKKFEKYGDGGDDEN